MFLVSFFHHFFLFEKKNKNYFSSKLGEKQFYRIQLNIACMVVDCICVALFGHLLGFLLSVYQFDQFFDSSKTLFFRSIRYAFSDTIPAIGC